METTTAAGSLSWPWHWVLSEEICSTAHSILIFPSTPLITHYKFQQQKKKKKNHSKQSWSEHCHVTAKFNYKIVLVNLCLEVLKHCNTSYSNSRIHFFFQVHKGTFTKTTYSGTLNTASQIWKTGSHKRSSHTTGINLNIKNSKSVHKHSCTLTFNDALLNNTWDQRKSLEK